MQKNLRRLMTPFILAASLAGCTTTHRFDPETCKTWDETSSQFLLALSIRASNDQKYSNSCRDGKTGAAVTLVGQDESGRLHPSAAKLGVKFLEIVQDKIKTGDNATKSYYADVMDKYNYYLFSLGNITASDVKKTFEEEQKQDQQKTPPVCKGEGVFRSCSLK